MSTIKIIKLKRHKMKKIHNNYYILAISLILLFICNSSFAKSSPMLIPEGLSGSEWNGIKAQMKNKQYSEKTSLNTSVKQKAYIKASNTGEGDIFGFNMGIYGDTMVVSALLEDSSAVGVNGDESDNSADDSGAAYVFVKENGVWKQQAYLKASNTDAGDFFDYSVAIYEDTIAISARDEASNAIGVDGDQSDNSGTHGAVYVFRRTAGQWHQEAYLKQAEADVRNGFGESIDLSEDRFV